MKFDWLHILMFFELLLFLIAVGYMVYQSFKIHKSVANEQEIHYVKRLKQTFIGTFTFSTAVVLVHAVLIPIVAHYGVAFISFLAT